MHKLKNQFKIQILQNVFKEMKTEYIFWLYFYADLCFHYFFHDWRNKNRVGDPPANIFLKTAETTWNVISSYCYRNFLFN